MNDDRDKTASEMMYWQTWREHEWKDWLNQKMGERKKVFTGDPDELIASYNRERSHARSYEGRELLELIQNADDAGAEYGKPNDMRILLTDTALYVANTGVPFSPEGIKSLMVSDNSPKQLERTRMIGYKGLAFRSVLAWASTIAVLSGKLSIGFSKEHAIEWLKSLINEDQKVRQKVEEVENKGLLSPIATLSVPYIFDPNIHVGKTNTEMCRTLYELRDRGYDTAISLVFDRPEETYGKLQEQMKTIEPDTLLFLQYLEKLEIISPAKRATWRLKREKDMVTVNPESAEPQVWKIFSESKDIPTEYRRPEQPLVSRYEIKLAVPRNSVEVAHNSNLETNMFTYFTTEVLFPFPLFAHVTFELTDNRQHLIESDLNRFLGGQLARLMADSAEKLVDPKNPWGALQSVTPQGNIDPVLSKLGFKEKLTTELSSRKIIPVLGGQFESAGKAKRIDGNLDDLLVGEEFRDICLYTENQHLKKLLTDIGVKSIEYDDLKERLNRLSRTDLSIERRADIIYHLVESKILDNRPVLETAPELLVDENGEPISADSRALLPPEGRTFSLPKWVPQRIVNPRLVALLKERFNLTRVRDLVYKLRAFNIQEYSMANLVSSIVAETNKRVKAEPDRELTLRQEMVQAIWTLYSVRESDEIPVLPEAINVILPTRKGDFRPANSLYLGKEYPEKILEYLYGPLGGPFVVGPAQLGLQGDPHEIESFLCWLGVSKLPKVIKTDLNNRDFLDNVLERIRYPARFGDTIIGSKDELRSSYPRLREVSTIDRLEEILDKADPHAIIAWVIKYSETLNAWRSSGDTHAKLICRPTYKQHDRVLHGEVIPSYPLWLLRNTKWLILANGEKQSPSRCTLARGVSKEVSALVGYPSLDLEHDLLKAMKVDKTTLKNALTTIGVVTELNELPWESFYDILLELPERDPEGKVARSVYRALIGREGDSDIPPGERYTKFLKEGKMWGRLGEKADYFPVDRLYYFENPGLPESALSLFPSLELDKRKGATKVKRLFGVEPFNLAVAQVKIIDYEEHPCSEDLQKEIDRLKPYIYALRVEEDSDRSELGPLRRLKVKLCKSVKGSICVGKEEKEIAFRAGESITVDLVTYLVAEPVEYNKALLGDEIIADAFGEIITSILKVEIGSDIARLAMCSPPRCSSLLNKIAGGSGDARLKIAEELLQSPLPDEEEYVRPGVPPIAQPISPSLPAPITPEQGATPSGMRPDEVGPVRASGGAPVQITSSRQITRRVRANAKPSTSEPIRRDRVNPDRAENLAIEFEKAQGRFAQKVSHFQGSEAYGCDVLSFKNKEDMENFKSKADDRLIERFIEVKGSVNSVGGVTLAGNQLVSAQTYRGRFFLYRIYEGETIGIFELVETQDPLGVEMGALKVQYEIHPFRTKQSKHYDVIEIDEDEEER